MRPRRLLSPVVESAPLTKQSRLPSLAADLALARRAAEREESAWKELYAMAQALLYNVAWRYGLDDEREDLLQDVMERMLGKIHTYRGESPLRVWVASVCYNRLRNAYRAARLQRRVMQPASSDVEHRASEQRSDARAIRSSERLFTIAAVAALGEAQRRVVMLRLVEERSVDETARTLGVPAGTVKSRLSRALGQLRDAVVVGRDGRLSEEQRGIAMRPPAA
jgi:RNA polymerase sigma-70 factor (ECF subfamily)